MGTLTKNTQPQETYVVSTPPSSRPMAPPAPAMPAHTPNALLRCGPMGNVVAIRAKAVGAASAPPLPCRARAASSHHWVVAKPPSSDPTEKIPRRCW